jgi:hypothetical protein
MRNILFLIATLLTSLLFCACENQAGDQGKPSIHPTETSILSTATTYAPLPDLAISRVYLEMEGRENNECVEAYSPYGIRVVIENVGEGNVGSFMVHLNDMPEEFKDGLPAGESLQIHFPGTDPSGQYLVILDREGQIRESNEENNEYRYIAPTPTPPPLCGDE